MKSPQGGYNSFWGILLLVIWNLELANDPTNPHYHRVDAAMIVPCFINCIIHFVSAQATSYNMQCQLNKDI